MDYSSSVKAEQATFLFDQLSNMYIVVDPIDKLNRRKKFNEDFRFVIKKDELNTYKNIDLFAIYDAVMRRGGYEKVNTEWRWNEILRSLDYYQFTQGELVTIYDKQLLELEKKSHITKKGYYFSQKRIEVFALSNAHLSGYFQRKISKNLYPQEYEFFKSQSFEHLDIFLCIRSIVLCHSLKGQQIYKISSYNIDDSYRDLLYKTFQFYLSCGSLSLKTIKPSSQLDKDLKLPQLNKLGLDNLSKIQVAVIGFTIPNLMLCLELLRFGFSVTLSYYPKQNKSDFESLIDFCPIKLSQFEGDKIYNNIIENKLSYHTLKSPQYINYQSGGKVWESMINQAINSFNQFLKNLIQEGNVNGQKTMQKYIEDCQLQFSQFDENENLIIQSLLLRLLNFDLPKNGKTSLKEYQSYLSQKLREISDFIIEPCNCFLKLGTQDTLLDQMRDYNNFTFISQNAQQLEFKYNVDDLIDKKASNQPQRIKIKYDNGQVKEFDHVVMHPNNQELNNGELGIQMDSLNAQYIQKKLKVLEKHDLPKLVLEFKTKFWKEQYFCTFSKKYGSLIFVDISNLKKTNSQLILVLIQNLPENYKTDQSLISEILQIFVQLASQKNKVQYEKERWVISSQFTINNQILQQQVEKGFQEQNQNSLNDKFNNSYTNKNNTNDYQQDKTHKINKNYINKQNKQSIFDLKLFDGLFINQCIFQSEISNKMDQYYCNIYNIINNILSQIDYEQETNNQDIVQQNIKTNQNFNKKQSAMIDNLNAKRKRFDEQDDSDSDHIPIKKKQMQQTQLHATSSEIQEQQKTNQQSLLQKKEEKIEQPVDQTTIQAEEDISMQLQECIQQQFSKEIKKVESSEIEIKQNSTHSIKIENYEEQKNIITNQANLLNKPNILLQQSSQLLLLQKNILEPQIQDQTQQNIFLQQQIPQQLDISNTLQDQQQQVQLNQILQQQYQQQKIQFQKQEILSTQNLLSQSQPQNIPQKYYSYQQIPDFQTKQFQQQQQQQQLQYNLPNQDFQNQAYLQIKQENGVEKINNPILNLNSSQIINENVNLKLQNQNIFLKLIQEQAVKQDLDYQQNQQVPIQINTQQSTNEDEQKQINPQMLKQDDQLIEQKEQNIDIQEFNMNNDQQQQKSETTEEGIEKEDDDNNNDDEEEDEITDESDENSEDQENDEDYNDDFDEENEEIDEESNQEDEENSQINDFQKQNGSTSLIKKPKGKRGRPKTKIANVQATKKVKDKGVDKEEYKPIEQLQKYYPFRQWKAKQMQNQSQKNGSNDHFQQMVQNFSLQNEVVINFNKFMDQMMNQQKQYFHQCMDLFELRQPLKVGEDKYIWKFGSPYINTSNKQLCFNNGFMSVYRDFSINHTNKSTYYLFTSMYINEHQREYYSIISGDNLKVILVHKDLNLLFNKFQKKMNKAERYRNAFCYYDFVNPNQVFQNLSHKLIYTSILESLSERQDKLEIEKRLQIECNEIAFFQSIEEYFKNQKKQYNVPEGLTLGDLFFGYYDPKIQLLMKLSKTQPNLKRDSSSKEIKFLFQKNIIPRKNDLQQEKISTEYIMLNQIPIPQQYQAQRKFIDYDNGQFEVYYGLEIKCLKKAGLIRKNQVRQQNTKFLLIKFDDQQMVKKDKKIDEFDSPQSCFITILQNLLNNVKNTSFLIEYMYQFINSEMRALKKLPKFIRFFNKLYNYEIPEIQIQYQDLVKYLTQISIQKLNSSSQQRSNKSMSLNQVEEYILGELNQIESFQYIQNNSIEQQNLREVISQYILFHAYVSQLNISIEEQKEFFEEYCKNPKKFNVIQSSQNEEELFLITSEQPYDYQSLEDEFQEKYQEQLMAKQKLFGEQD
ncbi:hypothetical protein TTHERM_00471800 (macronuclear) [Tetrahymena thermophila SB210]|uniref:ARID domain-containing protein n=1 Tax=Tetrahymena thermophila (strain SB210) TaxID=312017 RepID=I7MD31_TETTS|nr:hypothetical protein TTHERM_00471800 [Tetrahymena thermophila SB210]EAR85401.2 hypothetical protein TTHERM_00471800 [Tetrahymena thermophila SB210]|eukprot:XP_001033064.2 hypothetical protein TTHERM_00471800 [Tetrahymena thermophila SB210]